jgi:hypothetical protein
LQLRILRIRAGRKLNRHLENGESDVVAAAGCSKCVSEISKACVFVGFASNSIESRHKLTTPS